MSETSRLVTEIEQLTKDVSEADAQCAKGTAERSHLEAQLAKTAPSDEKALMAILERQRAIDERDELLNRRRGLSVAALQRAQVAVTTLQAAERKSKAITLRVALKAAETAARQASLTAAANIRREVETIQKLVGEIGALEQAAVPSHWATIRLDQVLSGAGAVLNHEEYFAQLAASRAA